MSDPTADHAAPALGSEIHTYYGDSYVLQGLSLTLPQGAHRRHPRPQRHGQDHADPLGRRSDAAAHGRDRLSRPLAAAASRPTRSHKTGIAIVPQGRRIFSSLSVRENLLLPTSVLARSANAKPAGGAGAPRWDFDEVLKEFPQLAERIDHPGGALSGGEQQMLAIGRALMANPELILMDEPSEGLSPRLVLQVQEIMQRLRGARPRDPAGRAEPGARAVGGRRRLRALIGAIRVSGHPGRAGERDADPRSASGRIGDEDDLNWRRRTTAMPTHHTLAPTPATVHWGYLDAKIPPRLTIDSGDT